MLDKTTQISAGGVPLVWGVSGVCADSAPMAVPLWCAAHLEGSMTAPVEAHLLLLCAFLRLQNWSVRWHEIRPNLTSVNSKTTPTAFRCPGLRDESDIDEAFGSSSEIVQYLMQG